MIFKCTCGYSWVLDFEHGQVIGPFYASKIYSDDITRSPEIVLSNPVKRTIEQFAEMYGDCLNEIYRRINGIA